MFKNRIFIAINMSQSQVQEQIPEKKFGFDVLFEVDKIATEVRKEREGVEWELDFAAQREDIKKRIVEAAKVRGETLSSDDIEKATDLYFDRQGRFAEPERNLAVSLAEMYADRRRIGLTYGIPAVAISTIALLSVMAVKGVQSARLSAQERGIENSVEQAYNRNLELGKTLAAEKDSPAIRQMPNDQAQELNSEINLASENLKSAKPFFDEYCPEGSADDKITRGNFTEVRDQLTGINTILDKAEGELKTGDNLIALQNGINSTRQGLDVLIKQERGMKAPKVLADKAESAYGSGLADIESRKLEDARGHETELKGVIGTIRDFASLPGEEAKTYTAVKAIAKEKAAVEAADRIHAEALAYTEKADVERLKQTVGKMKELEGVLNQTYTEYIIGGDRRVPDEDNTVIRYYLKIQRKDDAGNVLPVTILHEETKNQQQVYVRGERVGQVKLNGVEPENYRGSEPEAYAKVKADKMDNGVIDNSEFAKKEKGYLNGRVVMPGIPAERGQYPY